MNKNLKIVKFDFAASACPLDKRVSMSVSRQPSSVNRFSSVDTESAVVPIAAGVSLIRTRAHSKDAVNRTGLRINRV